MDTRPVLTVLTHAFGCERVFWRGSFGDVWEFTQEINNNHPAAFPVSLIDRIIASTEAKVILDPFMGSGTTAISAINHNRIYVGIDLSPDYCSMAEKRIKLHLADMGR